MIDARPGLIPPDDDPIPTDIALDREDVILLILEANERLFGAPRFRGVTRLEKILYLLHRETSFEGIGRFFVFVHHLFGPFSKEVYSAVEFLESAGLICVERTDATRYSRVAAEELTSERPRVGAAFVSARERVFSLTEFGRRVAKMWRVSLGRRRPQDLEAIDGTVRRYARMPLVALIRYVYRKYPETTKNSIHPEATSS